MASNGLINQQTRGVNSSDEARLSTRSDEGILGAFPMSIIVMDYHLHAREIVADAEKERTGAIRKGHRFRFIRHPFAQPAKELVGDFLSDEYFHN